MTLTLFFSSFLFLLATAKQSRNHNISPLSRQWVLFSASRATRPPKPSETRRLVASTQSLVHSERTFVDVDALLSENLSPFVICARVRRISTI